MTEYYDIACDRDKDKPRLNFVASKFLAGAPADVRFNKSGTRALLEVSDAGERFEGHLPKSIIIAGPMNLGQCQHYLASTPEWND
jgi:hypothetical protein